MADDEVFVEMQRAAVNLCRNLGYGEPIPKPSRNPDPQPPAN